MIRHGNSLFISLILHTTIAVLFIFTYKHVMSTKKEEVEKKICIELCNIVEQKPIIPPETTVKPKPIIEKPKPKPKPVVKKETIKEVPVVMEEPKPIIKEEKVEETKATEEAFEKVSKETLAQIPQQLPKAEQKVQDIQNKQKNLEDEYMQEHITKIVQLLKDNLYYPRRARAMREEGEVMVKFVLAKDASVHSVEVISSKSKILSRSAIKTIENLSGAFPKPKEELTLHVPIAYSLR